MLKPTSKPTTVATFRWQRRTQTILAMWELGGHCAAYIGSSPLVGAWNAEFEETLPGVGVYAVGFLVLTWVSLLPAVPRMKGWLDSFGVPRALTAMRVAASALCAVGWFLAGVAVQ